ncbi:MAG: 4Fe-4S binding protein, partial [Clostridiales bacterium]|nr:4Fe-4S binding protein [Candidatus Apopatocola equi]
AKRYIARNNIQLYTINAIDLAQKVGMGKRTNTILQSAFFTLASVLPQEDAIRYMKDAAVHSYLKKGQDVVDANFAAIDAGATAFVKIDVPADWADARDKTETITYEGFEKTVKMVKNILSVINRMDGDSLPVSTFLPHEDGTFELGASAYEKRGVSTTVPVWDPTVCAQCNQCAFVCPHATVRPFALTAEEAAAVPAGTKMADHKLSKGQYKFALTISPMDCMGCGVCVSVCPTHALKMVSQESQLEQQEVFNYLTGNISAKDELSGPDSVVKSQYLKPYLEFSGSCAGCAETSYARLVTQLFGDHMIISNATGCSSIWGGPAATSPYVKNKQGRGTAWANSLFEDNAENGYGIYLGQKTIRERLGAQLQALREQGVCADAIDAWTDSYNDAEANGKATDALVAALEKNGSDEAKAVLREKDYLAKKSVWIFGGDGWAFDIGFGGLDHVLASGEDVNVFVFNTEVYSNTGGQASKASNIGQVAEFAAAGKEVKSKSLAEIAMTYGYVYVAQVAMGANMSQTLKAIREAEAWHGPSLIIGYSPCEMHSIKGGMANCQLEMKKAVDCGYWNLFRYNPASDKPFTLDSKEPKEGYQEFLKNEARYARLATEFPERAEVLFVKNEQNARDRYQHLLKLKALYE